MAVKNFDPSIHCCIEQCLRLLPNKSDNGTIYSCVACNTIFEQSWNNNKCSINKTDKKAQLMTINDSKIHSTLKLLEKLDEQIFLASTVLGPEKDYDDDGNEIVDPEDDDY